MKRKQYLIGLDLCKPSEISVITIVEFKEGSFYQKGQVIIQATQCRERLVEITDQVYKWSNEYVFLCDS